MSYRITLKKHFKALEFVFAITIFIIACVCYFGYTKGFDADLINFFIIFFLVSFLPVFYLHLEYYLINRKTDFKIDSIKNRIELDQPKKHIILNFDEIELIIIYMAPSWHRRSNMQFLPIEQYHYGKIIAKNGTEILITCLMMEHVEDGLRQIKGVPIELKKRVFASILLEG